MAWVKVKVEQNKNKENGYNLYHLFQGCPWKMNSKTSMADIRMYMMKAHELMGAFVCQLSEEFLFLSPIVHFPIIQWEGERDASQFMPFSCIHFVCMWTPKQREKPILLAALEMYFPFQNIGGGLLASSTKKAKWSNEEAEIQLSTSRSFSWVQLWHGWFWSASQPEIHW